MTDHKPGEAAQTGSLIGRGPTADRRVRARVTHASRRALVPLLGLPLCLALATCDAPSQRNDDVSSSRLALESLGITVGTEAYTLHYLDLMAAIASDDAAKYQPDLAKLHSCATGTVCKLAALSSLPKSFSEAAITVTGLRMRDPKNPQLLKGEPLVLGLKIDFGTSGINPMDAVLLLDAQGIVLYAEPSVKDFARTILKKELGGDVLMDPLIEQLQFPSVGVLVSESREDVDLCHLRKLGQDTGKEIVGPELQAMNNGSNCTITPALGITVFSDIALPQPSSKSLLGSVRKLMDATGSAIGPVRILGSIGSTQDSGLGMELKASLPVSFKYSVGTLLNKTAGASISADQDAAVGAFIESKDIEIYASLKLTNIEIGLRTDLDYTPGIGQDPLRLTGVMHFLVISQSIGGSLSMKGTWNDAFGYKGFTVKDVALALDVNIETIMPTAFGFTGTATLPIKPSLPPVTTSFTVAFSIGDPKSMVFQMAVDRLTLQDLGYIGIDLAEDILAQTDATATLAAQLKARQAAEAVMQARVDATMAALGQPHVPGNDRAVEYTTYKSSVQSYIDLAKAEVDHLPDYEIDNLNVYIAPLGGRVGTIRFPAGITIAGLLIFKDTANGLDQEAGMTVQLNSSGLKLAGFLKGPVTIRNVLTLTRSTNPAANEPLPVWMGSTVCPKPYSDNNTCADWIATFTGPAAGIALSKEAGGLEVLVSGHLELRKFFTGDAYVHIKGTDVLVDCDGELIGWLQAGLNIHNDVDAAGRWDLKYSAHLSSEPKLQAQITEIETLVGNSLDSVFDTAVADLNGIKATLQSAQANLAQLQSQLQLCQMLLVELPHIWSCGTSITCQANRLACEGATVALPPMIKLASAGISTVMQAVQSVETGTMSIEQAVNSARDMVQKMQITGIKCEGIISSSDVTCNLSLDVAIGGQTVTVPAGDISAAGIAASVERALCQKFPIMKC